MREYFITAMSKAAPFASDGTERFVEGKSPEAALLAFVASYSHPYGLFAANVYTDANAYHKGAASLAQFRFDEDGV